MATEPIISVSGLRGVIGQSLTPPLAMRYVAAFASTAPAGPLVVTRDGRATGPMLADAVRSVLCAVGRDVIDADVAATPTTGVLVRHLRAAGGVQISASHNPPQYNGLKLFSPEGRVISAAAGQQVIDRYRATEPGWVEHDHLGRVEHCADPHAEHLRLVLATVDVERIRARRFPVLVDSNHGAGSLLARRLLQELGCTVTCLGDTPDGKFAHPPEPTADNLAGVLQSVRQAKAAVGFCQDPDADRLAVIDADGRYLGEEYTLALCVDHVLRSTPGPIATNCSTSRMSEDLAAKYGVACTRSAVGEANVTAAMLAKHAVFGGEGNGGPIDPRVGYVRDSFVGMALILDAMAARNLPIAALAAELPRYEICKTKLELPREKIDGALAALERECSDAQVDNLDGLRLDWPGKWLLVRASNTEPIVRAVAEAPTAAEAERLCELALGIMRRA
ncbi:MAG: phosphoglucosamine mutase [Pirellulales bacterium]|nr:phosphoglucosamine mutase [Pirellulales bacterium]